MINFCSKGTEIKYDQNNYTYVLENKKLCHCYRDINQPFFDRLDVGIIFGGKVQNFDQIHFISTATTEKKRDS